MTNFVDISPDTHFLESIRAQKVAYHVLLGEAVDNSFDAGAENISITLNHAEIQITDDGVGITRERCLGLVRLGMHMPTATTALGRYGVGIKHQAICAGDLFRVESHSATDGHMTLIVDWNAMVKSGAWKIAEPRWNDKATAHSGTKVLIGALRRQPSAKEIEKARSEIAEIFYPALVSGRAITFNGAPIRPVADPTLRDPVDEQIQIAEGKSARVRAGIVVDAKSKLVGVHLSYLHRVLDRRGGFGCEDYSTAGLFARVELQGKWGLTTFKDNINDPDEDELEERVHAILRPLLEQCKTESMHANVERMQSRLNAALPAELAQMRPQKQQELGRKGEKKGRIGIADSEQSSTGPARARKDSAKSSLLIQFGYEAEENGYGRFVPGKKARVILAQDNADIQELLKHRNEDAAERELLRLALMLYLAEQPQLDMIDSFGKRLWSLMRGQNLTFNEEAA